jgi:hypothetical protein
LPGSRGAICSHARSLTTNRSRSTMPSAPPTWSLNHAIHRWGILIINRA